MNDKELSEYIDNLLTLNNDKESLIEKAMRFQRVIDLVQLKIKLQIAKAKYKYEIEE